MKKTYIAIILVLGVLATSCESFLDTVNQTGKDTSNFPITVADANQLLAGAYSLMGQNLANNDVVVSPFFISEMASDDRFGGGGENDKATQALDRLQQDAEDMFRPVWKTRYAGIANLNLALETVDMVAWPDGEKGEEMKRNYLGEVHFLRAFYYFDLSQIFGEVPLRLKTAVENIGQSPAADTYAIIASDLKNAIEMLPDTQYKIDIAGHGTKWAAQALMARVFLFYTGYYKAEALPLPEGGSIAKAEVVKWLEECRDKSGHGLVQGDYRNLFTFANALTKPDYPAIAGEKDVLWAGDGNIETILAMKFNNYGDWGLYYGYSNRYCLYFGLRSATTHGENTTFPYAQGWGTGTVNPQMEKDWEKAEPNDLRRKAAVLDVYNDLPGYVVGDQRHYEETGYVQRKYIPISAYDEEGKITKFDNILYKVTLDYQLASRQDLIYIKYSDVLLMHSELTGTTDGMNKLRARAGLPNATAYSLAALQNERRWELAFEGLRWFDLLRWGIAGDILQKQENVTIKNNAIDTPMKHMGVGYKARLEQTGGFWAIPESQIRTQEGVLKQNKGWEIKDSNYRGW